MPAKKASTKKTKKFEAKEVVWVVVVTVLLGWILGYGYAVTYGDDESADEQAMVEDDATESDHKTHEMFIVPDSQPAPSVKILADKDAKTGWNITLVTENFEFTPEDVNDEDELGTGHAHIYVDGEKITRLYSPYYYLGDLGAGDHEVRVSLNTNSHLDYLVGGEMVQDTIEITELGNDATEDTHSHDDDTEHTHN